MKILRRKQPVAEPSEPASDGNRVVHRRVEISVEREWVSMLVRSRPAAGANEQSQAQDSKGNEPQTLNRDPELMEPE
jgi:hypothetical protein